MRSRLTAKVSQLRIKLILIDLAPSVALSQDGHGGIRASPVARLYEPPDAQHRTDEEKDQRNEVKKSPAEQDQKDERRRAHRQEPPDRMYVPRAVPLTPLRPHRGRQKQARQNQRT